MVMLNTSNITPKVQPINLYKQEKSFSILGDWLTSRKEIRAKGFKDYYAFIQRTCGERGYCYLKNKTIAEKLGSHPKTIQNYHNLSRQYNLIKILPTGRSSIFVPNNHHWIGLSEDQAAKLKPELPAFILRLIEKHYPSEEQSFPVNPSQTTENKETSETVESSLKEHVKDLRSMHAEKVSQPINITDSNIAEEKETVNINASTTTSASSDVTKEEPKDQLKQEEKPEETPKSIYSLEIILKWVLAYAMMKLGTNDPIDCHQSFATYCINSGEKDPWIAEYIANGYVLTPVNPLKDYQVEQPQEQSQSQVNTTQPAKQSKQKKNKPVEIKQVKGKYYYQIYLDYVNYEVKQGKAIRSVKRLTNWLHRTGAQDAQVGAFVEQMRTTYAGGKVPQAQNVNSIVDTTSNNTDNDNSNSTSADITSQQPTVLTNSTQSITSIPTPSIAEDLEVLRRATAIESLATTAWQTLTITQKEQLLKQTESNLLETKPQIYSQMTKQALSNHILGLVKYRLGEMLYKANTNNLTDLLKAIGKENFDSLEDYEQAELQEPKIDAMGYFYSCSVVTQHLLLEEICEDIYLELGIGGLAKRI